MIAHPAPYHCATEQVRVCIQNATSPVEMWTKAALGVPDRPALSPAAGISRSHSLEYDRMWSRDACAAQINVIVLAGVVQLHLILGGPRSGRPVGGRDDGVAARPPAVT